MHEADPVGAPGEVQRMAASWANDPVLPKGVQIRLVERGEFNLADLTKTQGRFDLPGRTRVCRRCSSTPMAPPTPPSSS